MRNRGCDCLANFIKELERRLAKEGRELTTVERAMLEKGYEFGNKHALRVIFAIHDAGGNIDDLRPQQGSNTVTWSKGEEHVQ